MAGIPIYNPLILASEATPRADSLVVTLLPEFVGSVVGGVIIRTRQKVDWATAFLTMTVTMLTSLTFGSLMINLFLS